MANKQNSNKGRGGNTEPPLDYTHDPPLDYGTDPPQDYGADPPQDYGADPPQDYGMDPPQDYGRTESKKSQHDTTVNMNGNEPAMDYMESSDPPMDYDSDPPLDYDPDPPMDYEDDPPMDYEEDQGKGVDNPAFEGDDEPAAEEVVTKAATVAALLALVAPDNSEENEAVDLANNLGLAPKATATVRQRKALAALLITSEEEGGEEATTKKKEDDEFSKVIQMMSLEGMSPSRAMREIYRCLSLYFVLKILLYIYIFNSF
jgi:hypothetical protein